MRFDKNKKDVDREDFFQIHTYISYYQNLGKNVIIAGLLYPLEETPTEHNIPPYLFGLENKEVKFIISGIVLPKTEDSNKSEKRKNIQEEFNKNKSSFIESLKQYLS